MAQFTLLESRPQNFVVGRRYWHPPGWVFGLAALGVLFCIWSSSPGRFLDLLELRSLDLRFRLRGAYPAAANIVLIVADEVSMRDSALGAWPWPYACHAKLVSYLTQAGAAAIVFDVLFLDERRAESLGLQKFAQACQASGKVYLACCSTTQLSSISSFPQENKSFVISSLAGSSSNRIHQVSAFLLPVPLLWPHIRGMGFIDVPSDPDGIFRRCLLMLREERIGSVMPNLPLAVALDQLGLKEEQIFFRSDCLCIGEKYSIPVDEQGYTWINFAGGSGARPTYSYAQVYHQKVPSEYFREKIVFIGVSAAGLQSYHPNPFTPRFLGIELQADILENLLQNKFLRPLRRSTLFIMLLLMGTISFWAAVWREPKEATLCIIGGFVIYVGAGLWVFQHFRLVIPLVGPSFTLFWVFLAVTTTRLHAERTARRRLLDNFSRYVPPQVVSHLDASALQAQLGGSERKVTALFIDIRNFTPVVSALPPARVVNFLNTYFSLLTDLVYAFEGIIDNIIGDELVVLFGALQDQKDQARRAVALALEMLETIRQFQKQWAELGFHDLQVGIGIDTGLAVVGNLGSAYRMHYTAIGQPINIASRLQSLTRVLEADILISEAVYKECQELITAECMGPVTVKGVPNPVVVWKVLGKCL